jgi:cell wall-associated NlpC family hydrolase
MTVTRQDIVAAARGYLGVRWHHQGRSKAGVDCLGLVVVVAHELGLSTADSTDYGRLPDGMRLRNELARHLEFVRGPGEPGDVLLFRFERRPMHVGIVSDIGLIHAFANLRKVVEHRLDDAWRARVVSAFRFPGVC